ncbi:MAG: hypothetical protein KGM99_18970, partial [Burkholderiales bacterium]|nr:hypothetical protein [Burkholderiales bacterium]
LQHELVPGTVLKEVNEQYVLISENGVIRRVELPQSVALNVNLVPPGITRNHEEVSPKVAPVAFPPHQQAIAPPGPINPAVAPLVTPGLPTASLPAAMPGSGQ